MLLNGQNYISNQQPMPVDDMSVSSSVLSITNETVSLYYSNSGTRTIDAGQAAGTIVMGQLANKNILDANGGYLATYKDTSLTFTGTCFTNEVKFPSNSYDKSKDLSWSAKLTAVTTGFANGDYCVDYSAGTVYGKKTTTASSLTATAYKLNQSQTSTTLITGDLELGAVELKDAGTDTRANILAANTARTTATIVVATQPIDAAGNVLGRTAANTARTAATLVDPVQIIGAAGDVLTTGQTANSATVTGFLNDLPMARYNAAPTARTEGQFGNFQASANGGLKVSLEDLIAGEDLTNSVTAMVEKPLSVSTYTLTTDKSAALEASSIAKASAGNMYRCFGVVDKTAATGLYYVLFLDSATLTADGAVTHLRTPEVINHVNGTDSTFDTTYVMGGDPAANGITVCLSTTMVTKTIAGAYLFFTIKFK